MALLSHSDCRDKHKWTPVAFTFTKEKLVHYIVSKEHSVLVPGKSTNRDRFCIARNLGCAITFIIKSFCLVVSCTAAILFKV